eukprot:Em0023g390a
MRTIDDGIIYKLNNSVPTASFADQVDSRKQCKELYDQLQEVYKLRTRAIQNCISETSQSVLALKERRDADREGSADIVKELRKEQTKVNGDRTWSGEHNSGAEFEVSGAGSRTDHQITLNSLCQFGSLLSVEMKPFKALR